MTTLGLACALAEQQTYNNFVKREQIISDILHNANSIRPGMHSKLLALDLSQLQFTVVNRYSTDSIQIHVHVPDSLSDHYRQLFPEEFI